MNAVHPELAWLGLVLALVPLAIHWLARPRPHPVEWAAMRFLVTLEEDRRRRDRLRDRLVLAARALAVIALGLALARPEASALLIADGTLDRVVVLDVSRSMAAHAGGPALIERARAAALEALRGPAGTRFGLVSAGARAQAAFPELTAHVGPLRREVATAQVRPEGCDTAAALQAAQRLLGPGVTGRAREVVVVTDLQRTGWQDLDAGALAEGVALRLEVVAASRPARNLAIAGVVPAGAGAVEVQVQNASPLPAAPRVELTVGQESWEAASAPIPPWSTSGVLIDVSRAGAPPWIAGRARLLDADDDLPDDDARWFAWRRERAVHIALLTTQPSQRLRTSPDYLARALSAGAGEVHVDRHAPLDLASGALARSEVLWLVRPGPLDDTAVATLVALAAGGTGLVYVAEEPADCENLRRLCTRAWPDSRPPPWTIAASAAETQLARLDAARPPFRSFTKRMIEALEEVPVRSTVRGPHLTGAARTEILAELSDGSPALVHRTLGRGALAVLTLDVAASPLSRSPLFVPLVRELQALVRPAPRDAASELPVGLPASLSVASGTGGAGRRLSALGGARAPELRWVDDASGTRAELVPLEPAVLELREGDRVLDCAAAECPAPESDLRPADPSAVLSRARSGGRAARVARAGDAAAAPLWPALALAAALLCCAELALLVAFA